MELPAKIVNEDLRRFFMPKKYDAKPEPEPVSEPITEVCPFSGLVQMMHNPFCSAGSHSLAQHQESIWL